MSTVVDVCSGRQWEALLSGNQESLPFSRPLSGTNIVKIAARLLQQYMEMGLAEKRGASWILIKHITKQSLRVHSVMRNLQCVTSRNHAISCD